MAKRKKSSPSIKPEEMIIELFKWNPHWSTNEEHKTKILNWDYAQLKAVYLKERNKIMKKIWEQHGLVWQP